MLTDPHSEPHEGTGDRTLPGVTGWAWTGLVVLVVLCTVMSAAYLFGGMPWDTPGLARDLIAPMAQHP